MLHILIFHKAAIQQSQSITNTTMTDTSEVAQLQQQSRLHGIPTSILPVPYRNRTPRPTNELIEDYLLHNLTDQQTLNLIEGVVFIEYTENSTYIGEVEERTEEKAGRGVYQSLDREVYMGDWKKGTFNGVGMYIFGNGDIYQGIFVNGQSTKGIIYFVNGDIYEGQLRDGFKHGQGLMRYYDPLSKGESQYSGAWRRGRKHGSGVFISDQITIAGNWEEDQINGEVLIKSLANQETGQPYWEYRGIATFSELIKGNMKVVYNEGYESLEGEIYKGKLEGKGKCITTLKGACYSFEGDFSHSRIQGKGTLKKISQQSNSDGILEFSGIFNAHSKAEGHGKIVYANTDVYEGTFMEGLKNGQGCYRFGNGDCYTGSFQHDQIWGHGTYLWRSKNMQYTGHFDRRENTAVPSRQESGIQTNSQSVSSIKQEMQRRPRVNWVYGCNK